jgi:hypothetical protein
VSASETAEGIVERATNAETTTGTDTTRYVSPASLKVELDKKATTTALSDHIGDATDAHDASAISYAGSTSLSATDVEAALDELDSEKASATGLSDHLSDATDAHDASAISFVPTGDLTSTDVQAAIVEHDNAGAPHEDHENTANRGVADGYARLGADGKLHVDDRPAGMQNTDVIYFTFDGPIAASATQVSASVPILDASVFNEYSATAENSGPIGGNLTINMKQRVGGVVSTILAFTMNASNRTASSPTNTRTDSLARGDEIFVEVVGGSGTTTGATKVLIAARRTM